MGLSPPAGVELVPMVIKGQNTPETFATIKAKGYREILGVNEPDGGSISGAIGASDAAKAWPDFVATGLRIGSPAPANTNLVPGDWFYEFMNETKAAGSRVDSIALHQYANEFNDVDTAVANFKPYIQAVRDMYKLPIWVTEFAMVDYYSSDISQFTVPDSETEGRCLTAACEMLEGLDYVERYAWFAVPENANQPAMNLFDTLGNINPFGAAYKAI